MSPRGNAVPEPQDGDSDAVVTALESAAIFHTRGDLAEAARWLRRGAELASDDGNDPRALALAQAAAELGPAPASPAAAAAFAGTGLAASEPEGPRAPVDDIMAELFDQPLAPAFKAKPHEPVVAQPPIPPPAALPSIPEPPPLLDVAPPPPPVPASPAALVRNAPLPERSEIPPPPVQPVVARAPSTAAAPPPLPSAERPANQPPRDAAPSSIPDGPPLRPSGMVSVTAAPASSETPTTEKNLKVAPLPEFDDNTPATVPQHDRVHQATKRTAIFAGQEALAQSMAEEAPEPGQTWDDQTNSESTSASWAVAPGVPVKSEPPPKPKPRAPTLSKLDIEWESPSAPRVSEASAPTTPNAAPAPTAAPAAASNPSTEPTVRMPVVEPAATVRKPPVLSTKTIPMATMSAVATLMTAAPAPTAPVPAVVAAPAAPTPAARLPVRTRLAPPTRRALRGTLQATTEDGVFVFVPLSAHERPQLHTHEALIVLLNPNASLDAPTS